MKKGENKPRRKGTKVTSSGASQKEKVSDKNTGKNLLYIVGIGGSAGGLEAFGQFFTHMPVDSGMAFVLVPHLDPTHKGMMPDLLQRFTKMQVFQAEEKYTNAIQKITILLRDQTGHDFSFYKKNTLIRRIERRMSVHQITNVDVYIRYLRENPQETELLFKELWKLPFRTWHNESSWITSPLPP